jgi:hypothetical protein
VDARLGGADDLAAAGLPEVEESLLRLMNQMGYCQPWVDEVSLLRCQQVKQMGCYLAEVDEAQLFRPHDFLPRSLQGLNL